MDVFVARQPILNKKMEIVAYELLYRSSSVNSFTQGVDGNKATSDVITNGLMLIGLDNLACGKKAFVNFTEDLLIDRTPQLFSKENLVVEILETIEPTEAIIEVCKDLKAKGYLIALDDFVFHPKYQPLIDIADIIKVDFLITSKAERKELLRRVVNKKIRFLAEKVETRADFEEAIKLGYSYFQGYFFSKPVIIAGKDIPASQISMMKLFQELNRKEPEFDEIAGAIEKDLSITYKLLKYINQSGQYLLTHITSIKHALMILGLDELKKWLVIIITRGMAEGKPDVITRTCMARARLSEKIAIQCGMTEASPELFILGMFSMIDVLMDKPMAELLKDIPISEEIKRALLGENNSYNDIFSLVVAYEKGDWDMIFTISERINIAIHELPKLYLDSLNWADRIYKIEGLNANP